MLTKEQILNRTKTVTRRMGWRNLKPGDRLQGVEKGMGLKRGEAIKKLAVIEVVDVGVECLAVLMNCPSYGKDEVAKEGFPEMTPAEFVQFFSDSHKNCPFETEVTRIEFRYVDQSPNQSQEIA